MGLLDSLVGAVSGQVGNELLSKVASSLNSPTGQSLLTTVVGMISNPETGGLKGLLEKANAAGLGEHVASWVGTGENLPVSAEQIHAVLGSETVQGIASQLGLAPAETASGLASVLPEVVNQLTPNGELPAADSAVLQQGLAALTQFFGK